MILSYVSLPNGDTEVYEDGVLIGYLCGNFIRLRGTEPIWAEPLGNPVHDLLAAFNIIAEGTGVKPYLPYEHSGCSGCSYYEGSPYLRCAVNPAGYSLECPHN